MSVDNFKCLNCNACDLEKSEIIILKCHHTYCWSCLGSYISSNLNSKVPCPFSGCQININDSVIRQALPNDKIKDYEKKSLSVIINTEQCFKCLLSDCENVVFFTDKDVQFECTNCSLFNCISCKGTHPFMSCMEYQKLKKSALTNDKHKHILENMEENEYRNANVKLQQFQCHQLLADVKILDSCSTIPNDESFNCLICCKVVSKGEGIKLRNCCHMFCKNCLHDCIVNSETIPICCLENSCKNTIQDREIRGILNEKEYEIFHDKCLMLAKSKLNNIFHCKKPDCKFFGIIDNINLENFKCPVCNSINCIQCNVIHEKSQSCKEYQMSNNSDSNLDAKSIKYIEKEIKEGKCMKCPTCGCIIKKIGGCNWIKCPQCKLELCWVLKIPRWGPKGNGDISGGCRCGVNNILCDPACRVGCIPEQ